MSARLSAYAPQALGLLRIVASLLFIHAGLQILFDVPHQPLMPPEGPDTLTTIAGILELGGGILLLVGFLSRPGADYTGGEFVMTRQVPRAQSQAIVLTPGKGDMLIFTTRFKPGKGIRGYYRIGMKHGVSEVVSGERFTLGIIFHDAVS